MPRKTIDGATITYAAADEDSAREIEALYTSARTALEGWGIRPQRSLEFRFNKNWWSFGATGGIVVTLFNWFLLPLRWYYLSFARLWPHYYAMGWIRDAARGGVSVKPLRALPAELPPQVRARFVEETGDIDRPTLWRQEICRCMVEAWLGDRLPRWVVSGLQQSVSRQIVEAPWRDPRTWQPIMKWTGYPPMEFDFRKLDALDQDQIDELVGRASWPRWSLQFLEAKQPGLLGQLIDEGCPKEQVESRLAAVLGVPPQQFWEGLGARVVEHYEGRAPDEPRLVLAEPLDNPFASPGAGPPPKPTRSLWTRPLTWLLLAGGLAGALGTYWLFGQAGYPHWALVAAIPGLFAGLWLVMVLWVAVNVLLDLARGRR